MKRIVSIRVKQIPDPAPDLSWLETRIDGGRIVSSCRYSDADIAKYGLDRVLGWADEDGRRLADYGDTWHMIGVVTEATIQTSDDGRTWLANTVRSMGIWGVESDSTEDYLRELEREEIEGLRAALVDLGFPASQIQQALAGAGLAVAATPARTRVIVAVHHGMVAAAYSTDARLDVAVLDWDTATENREAAFAARELEKETQNMCQIL